MVHGLAYEGMLTLSGLCLISIIASKMYHKTLNKIMYVDVEKIIRYVDMASVACTFAGIVFLAMSVSSSLLSFTAKTLTDSLLFSNQMMLAISAMILWIAFLAIRALYGRELWNSNFPAAVGSFTGLAGFFLLILAGSIRGHLQRQGSIIDPLYEVLNIDPIQLWSSKIVGIYTLVAISVLAGVSFLSVYWKLKTS